MSGPDREARCRAVCGESVSVPRHELGDRSGLMTASDGHACARSSEDSAFIAPNMVFADDPHPPCGRHEERVRGAVVKQGARIGLNSTILPGVVIERGKP